MIDFLEVVYNTSDGSIKVAGFYDDKNFSFTSFTNTEENILRGIISAGVHIPFHDLSIFSEYYLYVRRLGCKDYTRYARIAYDTKRQKLVL